MTTATQHFQGHRHRQRRAAFHQLGRIERPFVGVRNSDCPQLLNNALHVGQAEEVIDDRAQLFQWCIGQLLHTQLSQQALKVPQGVAVPGQLVQFLVQLRQHFAFQVPIGEAAIQRVGGADLDPGDPQINTDFAGDSRQEIAAANVREITDGHFRHPQPAALGDHPQIRALGQAHAATQDVAVHQRQHRFAVVVKGQVEGVFLEEEIQMDRQPVLVAVVQRTDIATGAEGLFAAAAQNHGINFVILGPGIQLLLQRPDHVQGDRVQTRRAVEGQVTDVVTNADQHRIGDVVAIGILNSRG